MTNTSTPHVLHAVESLGYTTVILPTPTGYGAVAVKDDERHEVSGETEYACAVRLAVAVGIDLE